MKKWASEDSIKYIDDKKISDWNRLLPRNYFPIELFQSDTNNVIKKSDIVNEKIQKMTRSSRKYKTTNPIISLDDEVSRVIGELSISKGDNVVKENENFLSRVRQVSYSSFG